MREESRQPGWVKGAIEAKHQTLLGENLDQLDHFDKIAGFAIWGFQEDQSPEGDYAFFELFNGHVGCPPGRSHLIGELPKPPGLRQKVSVISKDTEDRTLMGLYDI